MCSKTNKAEPVSVGNIRFADGRFEFHCPEYDLVIRGRYLEWVLEAASEVIARTEQIKAESKIEEMKLLAEFDGETTLASIDAATFDARQRFRALPQCVVSMGHDDYRWVHVDGRDDKSAHPCTSRIVDQSATRERGDWLRDEPRLN